MTLLLGFALVLAMSGVASAAFEDYEQSTLSQVFSLNASACAAANEKTSIVDAAGRGFKVPAVWSGDIRPVEPKTAALLEMYAKVGLPHSIDGIPLAPAIGWFELALAAAVLVKPFRGLLVFVCVYRVMTGLLHPISGEYWWEFIERGADYVAPIALLLVGNALIAERARARAQARVPIVDALSTTPVTR